MSNGEKIEPGNLCSGDVPRIPPGVHGFIGIREADIIPI